MDICSLYLLLADGVQYIVIFYSSVEYGVQ